MMRSVSSGARSVSALWSVPRATWTHVLLLVSTSRERVKNRVRSSQPVKACVTELSVSAKALAGGDGRDTGAEPKAAVLPIAVKARRVVGLMRVLRFAVDDVRRQTGSFMMSRSIAKLKNSGRDFCLFFFNFRIGRDITSGMNGPRKDRLWRTPVGMIAI